MALPYDGELDSITEDYYALEADGKPVNNYFDESFNMEYFFNKKKALYELADGGDYVKIPIIFDEAAGGVYGRADGLDSDDREGIHSAKFEWKHYFANATIYRHDELKNKGPYAKAGLVASKLMMMDETIKKWIATDFYSTASEGSDSASGFRMLCNETSTTPFGGLQEDDLVSESGAKVWAGLTNSTSEAIGLGVLRTLKSDAKVGNGAKGKPDYIPMTEALFNKVKASLQAMQRYTEDKETTKVGFTNLVFEGSLVVADDYCPSGYAFAINTNHTGIVLHEDGNFFRSKWKPLSGNVEGKTMKVLTDWNLISNRRSANKAHSNLE